MGDHYLLCTSNRGQRISTLQASCRRLEIAKAMAMIRKERLLPSGTHFFHRLFTRSESVGQREKL